MKRSSVNWKSWSLISSEHKHCVMIMVAACQHVMFAPLSICVPVLYLLMYCVITGILYVLLLDVFYSYVLSLHDCTDASLFSLILTDLTSFSYLNSIFFLSFFDQCVIIYRYCCCCCFLGCLLSSGRGLQQDICHVGYSCPFYCF